MEGHWRMINRIIKGKRGPPRVTKSGCNFSLSAIRLSLGYYVRQCEGNLQPRPHGFCGGRLRQPKSVFRRGLCQNQHYFRFLSFLVYALNSFSTERSCASTSLWTCAVDKSLKLSDSKDLKNSLICFTRRFNSFSRIASTS